MHDNRGRKQSPEHIRKRLESRRNNGGFNHSEETKTKIRKARALQIITPEMRKHIGEAQKRIGNRPPVLFGKEHPAWKGDKVGYHALHTWITRRLGSPSKCERCGTTTAKRFQWANISHKYKRDLGDWMRLCPSCHIRYDNAYRKTLNNTA